MERGEVGVQAKKEAVHPVSLLYPPRRLIWGVFQLTLRIETVIELPIYVNAGLLTWLYHMLLSDILF